MLRTLATDAVDKIGKTIKLQGFIEKIRDHGKITFLDIRDMSGLIQCVGENLPKVTPQSAVEVSGVVNKRPSKMVNKNIKTGTIEVWITRLEILSKAEELPFDMGGRELNLQLPTLLEFFHPVLLLKLLLKTLGLKWGLFRHHQSLELT